MPFGGVEPNGNWECFTRSNLARAVLVKTQYTAVGLDIEVSIVNGPVLEPLAAMLAFDERLIHPEAL
jgi:hypothetical protein